jgi:ornithine cyclodeaminase/alanine dehydrogenase-like protein (mu-crystallin family)
MEPRFINKEKIIALLPMQECIAVMEEMFRSLAEGTVQQPLRSVMWLPDKKGLLGMMPGYAASTGMMGIKVITVFHGNRNEGYPSHQGVVILFDAKYGEPAMIFDAGEITAIRTAAASAVATRLLANREAETLAIIGSGVQAEKHIEAISCVRKIKQINICSRQQQNAESLSDKVRKQYKLDVTVLASVKEAVANADIICTVTSSAQPVLMGEWIRKGTHINAVGSSTPVTRELDTNAILRCSFFTDKYESLFNEGGDFLIPEKEGVITKDNVKAELSEVVTGKKKGRVSNDEITLFKSLGISAEDIFSAWHIYRKLQPL